MFVPYLQLCPVSCLVFPHFSIPSHFSSQHPVRILRCFVCLYSGMKCNVLGKLAIVHRAEKRDTFLREAPQDALDKRRHWKSFHRRRFPSLSKKLNTSEVRGQMMCSNPCGSSPTLICMLSVTDVNPKGTFSECWFTNE